MAAKKNRNQAENIIAKMFIAALVTATVTTVAQTGANFIDGFIVSSMMGPDEMGAIGLVMPLFIFITMISGCIATGMQLMCTKEIGRGRIERTSEIFSQAFQAGALISSAVGLLMILLRAPIAQALGARGEASDLLAPTCDYLIGVGLSVPLMVLSAIAAPAVQLSSGNRRAQLGAIVCAVSNVVMDIVFSVLGWGVWGIGMATAGSSLLNLVVLLASLRKKNQMIELRLVRIKKSDFGEIIRLGQSKIYTRLFSSIAPIIVNRLIIAVGGSIAMTVIASRNNINILLEIPGGALGMALVVMIGIFYGEVNSEDMLTLLKVVQRLFYWSMIPLTVVVIAFSGPIAQFYMGGEGEEALRMMRFAVICTALRTPVASMNYIKSNFLQASHNVRKARILSFFMHLVSVLFYAIVLVKLFGTYGIIASALAADTTVLFGLAIIGRIKSKKWIKQGAESLMLKDSFRIGPENVISLTVQTEEDVALLSWQISLFCKGHGLDEKRAYLAGLAAEEYASFIIQKGFPGSNVKTIDIRVVFDGDDLCVRVRDYCPNISFVKSMQEIEQAGKEMESAYSGIRMVQKLARDISYYRTMNANHVMVRV